MDSRAKEIAALEKAISEFQDRFKRNAVELGGRILQIPPEKQPTEALRKYAGTARALRKSLEEMACQIEEIGRTKQKIQSIQKQIDTLQRRMEQISRDANQNASSLGLAAYKAYRATPAAEAFRAVFEPILEIDMQIEELQNRVNRRIEERKKRGLLGKVVETGAILRLRTQLKRRQTRKTQRAREVGLAIAEREFGAYLNGEARYLFDLTQKLLREKAEVEKDLAIQREALSEARKAMTRLGADPSPDVRIRDLETRIRDTHAELDGICFWVAEEALRSGALPAGEHELESGLAFLRSLQAAIAEKTKRIDTLRIQAQIDAAAAKEEKLRQKIARLREEIQHREKQAEEAEKERSLLARQMEELRASLPK